MTNYLRKCSLLLDSGQIDLGTLRVVFKIEASSLQSPNMARFRVYNVNPSTAAKLAAKEFSNIAFSAGYEQGAYGKIYRGLRDSADVATDLGDRLAEMAKRQGPYGLIQALAQGHTYDLSDGTTRALMNHQYRSREQEALDDQKRVGANPNETAKTAKDFEQSMRHLNELLGAIETKVTDHLGKALKPLIDQLTKFAEDHGSDIADIINDIGDAIIAFAKIITEKLETLDWKKIAANVHSLTEGFTAMLAKLGGDAGLIALLGLMVTHLKGLGGLGLPGWLKAILGISAATDLAIPNDQKPGMTKRWDDSAGGLPGDLGNSDMDEADKRAGVRRGGRSRFGKRVADDKAAAGAPGVPYTSTSLKQALGLSDAEYDAYREGVTDIEGKAYGRMGGSSGRYAGRYQMGPAEITDTARRLGVARPSNDQFLKDPAMQEKFFENYTKDHYDTLMRHPKFAAMSKKEKLQILGYAHNQGTGSARRGKGAWGYLDGGGVGHDAFGTGGDAYFGPIGRRFDKAQVTKIPPMLKARPLPAMIDPTRVQGGADGKAVVLAPQHISSRGDMNVNHNQTFNIAGGDPRQNMEAARLSASRGQQDLLRNVQGALA